MKIEIKLGQRPQDHEIKFDGVVQTNVESFHISADSQGVPLVAFCFCHAELSVEFEGDGFNAMNDGTHTFEVGSPSYCQTCKGRGELYDTTPCRDCPECNGTGDGPVPPAPSWGDVAPSPASLPVGRTTGTVDDDMPIECRYCTRNAGDDGLCFECRNADEETK